MTAILLAYSATTYLFSGSFCYLAFLGKLNQNTEKFSSSKLSNLWIAFLWPLWMIREVKAQDSQPEIKKLMPKMSEYLDRNHELTSTSSTVVR